MSTLVSVDLDRLSSARDVRRVLRRGRRRAGSGLAVHVLALPERAAAGAPARMTAVASGRLGNAVARNRAKRLLREAGRRIDWPVGTDVVLVARPGIVGADLWAVLDELHGLVPGSSA